MQFHHYPLFPDPDEDPLGELNAAGQPQLQMPRRQPFMPDLRDYEQLTDVEIFRSGTWNGDRYTNADLDEMVGNFHKVGFRVPVKLGHKEVSGGRAFGWVSTLRRVGDKLIANFTDVPKVLFNMIKERAFDAVSAEIFWDLTRNGQRFRRVLKAVALLGAETPAVSALAPLRETFTADELDVVHSCIFACDQTTEESDMSIDTNLSDEIRLFAVKHCISHREAAQQIAGRELDLMTKSLMSRSSLKYQVAFYRVTHDPKNEGLFNLYAGTGSIE